MLTKKVRTKLGQETGPKKLIAVVAKKVTVYDKRVDQTHFSEHTLKFRFAEDAFKFVGSILPNVGLKCGEIQQELFSRGRELRFSAVFSALLPG